MGRFWAALCLAFLARAASAELPADPWRIPAPGACASEPPLLFHPPTGTDVVPIATPKPGEVIDVEHAERLHYLVPPEMVTCWVSLHATEADAGPLAFVRGSHTWPKSPPERTQFHAPDDWLAGARNAAPAGIELETVPVVVKAGGGSFHHGLTWHGSAPNESSTVSRMALVSHYVPVQTRFHETNVDVTYSRYRRHDDLSLDESFFPVVWDETGYRTPWLSALPDLG